MRNFLQCIQANGVPTPGCDVWQEPELFGVGPICPTCKGKLVMPIPEVPEGTNVIAGVTAEINAATKRTVEVPGSITPVGARPVIERAKRKSNPLKDRVVESPVEEVVVTDTPAEEAPSAPALNDDEDDYVVAGTIPGIPEFMPNLDVDVDDAAPTNEDIK